MPKTIVISDSHQRIADVEKILSTQTEYDEVVFLGDWFDSFYEPPVVAGFEATCEYLKHLILEHPNREKFVFLVGNHDISYIFSNNNYSDKSIHKVVSYFCSGFTKSKAKKFRKCFFDKGLRDAFFLEHFKIAHQTQGFTLSHAGLAIQQFPYGTSVESFVNVLLPDVWRNFRNLAYNHNWLISEAGLARGGRNAIGGVLWLDWNEEFVPSYDIGKQIVGHTTIHRPDCVAEGTPYESWNLDTCRHYGILVDGKLTTHEI